MLFNPSAFTLAMLVYVVSFCYVGGFAAVSPRYIYFMYTVHCTPIIVYSSSRIGLFSKLLRSHTTASQFFDRGFMDVYVRYMLPLPSCTIDCAVWATQRYHYYYFFNN